MKKMIVYFHGLNSSPVTEKVQRLKQMFPNDSIYAFKADVDPDIALDQVAQQIEYALVENYHIPGGVYFIGTSLGGWLASKMSDLFKVPALLINPCYDPVESLKKYPELSEEVRSKYTKLDLSDTARKTYAVDPYDEVIDMKELLATLGDSVQLFPNVGHRFNGSEFNSVVKSWVK